MKQNLLLIAAGYFTSYPTENTMFFTKDEQAFFNLNDAINHGKSLREKESDEVQVTTVTREQATSKEETPTVEKTKEEQIAEAKANVENVKNEVAETKASYDEANAKLNVNPNNKTFQKSNDSRLEKLRTAEKKMNDAQAALDLLSA